MLCHSGVTLNGLAKTFIQSSNNNNNNKHVLCKKMLAADQCVWLRCGYITFICKSVCRCYSAYNWFRDSVHCNWRDVDVVRAVSIVRVRMCMRAVRRVAGARTQPGDGASSTRDATGRL